MTIRTAGRTLAQIDALSHRTTTVYDVAGQKLAMINALSQRTSMAYDLAGRRISVTDGNGHRVTFLFDAVNRDVGSIDPLGRRVTLAYDAANRKTLKIDPRLNRVSTSYDVVKRKTLEKFSDGTRITSTYDPVNNRLLMNDWIGRTSSIYDALNRVVVQMPALGGRISYSFNTVGQRNRMIDPQGGRFSYIHDAAMQLTGLLNPQSHRTSLIYDPVGRQTVQILGNGARTTQVFNAASWLAVQIQADSTGGTRRTSSLYDPTGRRVATNESTGSRVTWTFDPTGQLVQEQGTSPSAYRISYIYDNAGNRLVENQLGTRTTSTYDAGNELLVSTTGTARTTYTYDNNGNRTQMNAPAALTVYSWDVRNQLVVAEPVSGYATYTYDGNSNRVEKQVAGTTTQYLYDFEKLLSESQGGSVTREYTSTDEQYGDLISAYGGGTNSYYEFTPQFATEALLNDAATVTDRYAYLAFGLATHTAGTSTNPMTFVGKQGYYSDTETDQYYVRKRYYDPVTGRWLTEDRDGYRGGDANLYRYCFNDPVNHTDPSGNRIVAGFVGCSDYSSPDYNAIGTFSGEIAYAFTNSNTRVNLNIGNGPAINSNVYAYINSSLRPYPSYIWNWIHAEVGQRGNNGPDLARRIKQGLTQNLLISRETKRDEIDSGNPSWVGWESFAGYRTSDNFRLREGLKWSEEFPGKPTILIIDEFLNQVEEGIKAAGEILEVALEAGFSTVLQLVGFNPKEFFETIKHLGDILQQIAPAILNNYDEFGTNFVEGLNLGFKEFFKNFPDNVVGLALKWLLGTDLEGIKIPAKVNAKTLFSFALDPTFREFVLRFLGDYLEG